MLLFDPRFNLGAKQSGKLPHFIRFQLRNSVRPLVVRDVAFLAEHVKLSDRDSFQADCERQRLDYVVVVVGTLSFVTGGS